MIVAARVRSRAGSHEVEVRTGDVAQSLQIAPKASGRGSSVNGGELLMLALATCYCNDLFREAQRLGLVIESAEVEASAEFAGVGIAAKNIRYKASIESTASAEQIARLIEETDAVAEVHNTIRGGAQVKLERD